MTDKEVGDLWRMFSLHENQQARNRVIVNLIRKLVLERARMYVHDDNPEAMAWRDFGIDPKDEDTSWVVRGAYKFARRLQGKPK